MKAFWSKVVAFFSLRKARDVGGEVYERYDLEEWPEVERECYIFRYVTPAQRKEGSRMKSKGHILFFDAYEYFRRDGHIYKALKSNPIQIDGYRHGRWEGYDRQQTLDCLERIAAAYYKEEEGNKC